MGFRGKLLPFKIRFVIFHLNSPFRCPPLQSSSDSSSFFSLCLALVRRERTVPGRCPVIWAISRVEYPA